MKQVFISYSSQEAQQANEIVKALESQGIECWIAPRDIPTGSDYMRAIPAAIGECPFFLVLLSRHSQNSKWVLNELSSAISRHKRILPLMLEDLRLDEYFNFLLATYQNYQYYVNPYAVVLEIVRLIQDSLPQAPHSEVTIIDEPAVSRHIFISHSSENADVAKKIADHLEKQTIISSNKKHRLRCWMAPRDTRSHTTFPAQITQAIRECPVFLLLVSKESMASTHVEREIALAIDRHINLGYKYIIPLMLDKTALNDDFCYYLANLHYYDYCGNPDGILQTTTEQIIQFIQQEHDAADKYMSTATKHYQQKDFAEALRWYHKAAALGHVEAQAMLGYCYHTGKTGNRNMAEAVKWYRTAADQGHTLSQGNLGLCFAYEPDVPRDWNKAVALFRQAAEKGHSGAQYYLGSCYENGTGVPRDREKAMQWYRVAANNKESRAIKRLEQLAESNPK